MLDRLIRRMKGEPRSVDKAQLSSDRITTATSSSSGLTLLTKELAEEGQYPVDIIAVHGLNGDAFTTWTHPNGNMWIRDLLPGLLPGCRVYTYGYPSQLFFNPSFSRVRDFAKDLLGCVRDMQDDCHEVFYRFHLFNNTSNPTNRSLGLLSSSVIALVALFASRFVPLFQFLGAPPKPDYETA